MKNVSKVHNAGIQGILSEFERHYPRELVYWDSLQWQLLTWLNKQGLLHEERLHAKEKVLGILKFAPRLFPYANPRLQLLFAKLFTLLFIMDDQADTYPDNYWEKLWDAHLLGCTPDLITQSMEVIQLINLHRSTPESSTLVVLLKEFIYAGMLEKKYWLTRQEYTYQDYLDFKMNSSGVTIAFECLNIAHPESLHVLSNHQWQKLKHHIAALIILSNDLDSYTKELKAGDTNNLVILYHLHGKLKLTSAVAKVRRHLGDELCMLEGLLGRYLQKFQPVKGSPFILSKTIPDQLGYIQCLHRVVALYWGCKTWSSTDTARYQKR